MTTKETNKHLREKYTPTPVNTGIIWEVVSPDREWSRCPSAMVTGNGTRVVRIYEIRRNGQLSGDTWRSSRKLVGDNNGLESNRNRQSVNKGTREVRPSMVIAWLSCKTTQALPKRRSDGGASVVVRDDNNVHMAKRGRMIRFGRQKCSSN